jgi:hypothetical protein
MTDALRDVDPDDLRQWHAALPAHLARAFTLDHATIPALRSALERHDPAELARICTVGITRQTANIRGLILYRLRREAGQLDDQEVT